MKKLLLLSTITLLATGCVQNLGISGYFSTSPDVVINDGQSSEFLINHYDIAWLDDIDGDPNCISTSHPAVTHPDVLNFPLTYNPKTFTATLTDSYYAHDSDYICTLNKYQCTASNTNGDLRVWLHDNVYVYNSDINITVEENIISYCTITKKCSEQGFESPLCWDTTGQQLIDNDYYVE